MLISAINGYRCVCNFKIIFYRTKTQFCWKIRLKIWIFSSCFSVLPEKNQASILILTFNLLTKFVLTNSFVILWETIYSKTCVNQLLKNRQNKDPNDKSYSSLLKVKRIAECSKGSLLQYFWPALSDTWSWKPIFLRVANLHSFYYIQVLLL